MEVELVNAVENGYAKIDGALIIGRSENADQLTNSTPSHGIIGPRTENFQVHNVKFYNFDVAGKAAFGTCSHCFSPPSTDSGGRTLTVNNIYFDQSVKIRIRYQVPYREIIYDMDGSLTGLGPNSFAMAYWRHNDWPECTKNMFVYDGHICDSRVQVRRIVFHNYAPDIFNMMDLKILQYEDSVINAMNNVTLKAYKDNIDNYSFAPWRPKINPMSSWALPYVTGKKYKLHWQNGLDWTQM